MAPLQTVYLPNKDYTIPSLDILSLIYDSPESWTTESTILHAEAALPSNSISKAQSRSYTKRLAWVFRHVFSVGSKGAGKDVVVCMSSGQILLSNIFYGVIGAGGVFSAASSAFTPMELARQIRQGKSSLVVCSEDCRDVAIKAAQDCGLPLDRVLVLQSMGGVRSLRDVRAQRGNLLDGGEMSWMRKGEMMEWERVTDPTVLRDRVVCLLYSSGTTGVPKGEQAGLLPILRLYSLANTELRKCLGVNISHQNLVSEGLIPQYMIREYFVRQKARDPSFTFEYRTLAHLPAAHIAGCQGYFVNPSIAGGPVYWMPKFDFPKFLEYNKKFRITTFFTVPPIYLLCAKSPLVTDQFETLVHAISGAAPMGAELQALAEKKLGCNISQTWGLSETTGSVTAMPWDENDLTGSVSPLLPNTRMRIVDDDEKDVPEGQEGEFIMQAPMVTTGYWDNEVATREAFTQDGKWFKTGDVGVCKNGKFYVVDRKKVTLHATQLSYELVR
jgi:4-coumarate--CoA ligase